MSDLIDRQAAIDAFDGLPNCPNGYSDTYDKACIIGVLEDLPSAQLKKGKWIYKSAYTGAEFGFYTCSVCEKPYWQDNFNFCPNCGADMRGKENEID